MSVRPKKAAPKKRKINPNDIEFQKYIRSIQWGEDPKKSIAQLKRLAKELEADIDVGKFEYDVVKKYKAQDARNARKWFKEEVRNLLVNPAAVDHKQMSRYTRRQSSISLPKPSDIGKMFFYGYNPKTKNTLPYYDILPLILMVKGLDNGWHGLNLHYLPPRQREIIILRLMEHMSNTRLDNRTRLKLSYNLLKGVSKYRYFKPCFKRYLISHVKTTVKPIPFRHWPKAILLPVAKFKKASITSVWADSMKIARGA